MQKLGAVEASVLLCDACDKRISIRGIQVQGRESGEYRVKFFTCPHCGALYQINTTDEKQRELLNQAKIMRERLRVSSGRGIRPQTIRRFRKEAEKAERELKERAPELRKIGEEILSGGRKDDGSQNGDRGTEGV